MQTDSIETAVLVEEKITDTTLAFIDGNFTHNEANELLSKLVSVKINFLKLMNLSMQEHYGRDEDGIWTRIEELQTDQAKMQIILSQAKAQGKRLTISSEIKISAIDW